MKVSPTQEDWRDVVYCGVENQQIDFKSAQDWNELSRSGRAKFARHAMALANTMGGYVVVGVGEDSSGVPNVYQGMTDKQAASFDPSAVGQTINRYADPAVDFDIVRPEIDGKTFVVFVVYPFRDMPHVCGDACEAELQRGVFYVRTPEAQSRAAYRSSELRMLIQRSLRNQRESLGRMLRGILYEDRQGVDASEINVFEGYLQRARTRVRKEFGNTEMRTIPRFEAIFRPGKMFRETTLTEVRRTLEMLDRPMLKDFPFPGTQHKVDSFATNESLRGCQTDSRGRPIGYWEFFQNGLLYCTAPLPVGAEWEISAEDVLTLVSVSVAFAGQLYTHLNRPSDLLTMTLRLCNSHQVSMISKRQPLQGELKCQIPDVEVSRQRTAGDLEAGGDAEVSAKLFLEICERFNATFDNVDYDRIKDELSTYLRHGLLP